MRRESLFDGLFDVMVRPDMMFGGFPTADDLGFRMAPPMPLDVIKTETGIKVKAVLSGVSKDDLDIRVKDGNVLIIKASSSKTIKEENAEYVRNEIRTGTSERCIDISDFKADTIKSSYVDGVLEITMDRKEPPTDEEKNGVKINIE